MGNVLAQPQRLQPEHLAELPNVVLKDTLGGGRFMKTLLCVHDDGGLVVVKVYQKRPDSPPLDTYKLQLIQIRNRLVGLNCSHVWPYTGFLETANAAYMLRQHLFADLYDRLSTRPFLTNMEKRWILFQLLHGLVQCHERGVCHGDIKCENVLLTSWNWAFLSDFACYKPTYLPDDNPAEFSMYFDTGGRRRCYIAPERFFSGGPESRPLGQLTPQMDIFSLGCVGAEMFIDGKAVFDLSQLLAYRRGDFNPEEVLASVDADVRPLLLHMMQRDPAERWSASRYLEAWPRPVFPPYFSSSIHTFFSSLLIMDPEQRVSLVKDYYAGLQASILAAEGQIVSTVHSSSQQTPSRRPATPTNLGAFCNQPFSLLSDVYGLLADSAALAERVQSDGTIGPAHGPMTTRADEGAFLLDDVESRTGECPASTATAATSTAAIDEIMTDEKYEYQSRDLPNETSWSGDPYDSSKNPPSDAADPPPGWTWDDGWKVDMRRAGCDEGGWEYRSQGVTSTSGRGWGPEDDGSATQRRRRWLRTRRHRAQQQRRRGSNCQDAVAGPSTACLEDSPNGASARSRTESGQLPAAAGAGSLCGSGMVLLTGLLCTLLRGPRLQESKRAAISLVAESALHCEEEVRLQLVVPHLLSMTLDGSSVIRTAALRSVSRVMCSVSSLPPSEAGVFRDYLLPGLSLMPTDVEEGVRVEYALNLARLATASFQHLKESQVSTTVADQAYFARIEEELSVVRGAVEKSVLELVTGLGTTPDTKRALLKVSAALAAFFGRRDMNDVLLPLLITCLNAGEWQLRAEFFNAIASIGKDSGRDTLDVFLLPCLEQALTDSEVSVIVAALRCVSSCAPLLHQRSLLAAARSVAPLLGRSGPGALRTAAITFITAVARCLSPADMYTQLMSVVEPYLSRTPPTLTDVSMLASCVKEVQEGESKPRGRGQGTGRTLLAPSNSRPTPLSFGPSAEGSAQPSPSHMRSTAGMRHVDLIPALGSLTDDGESAEMMLRPMAPLYCVDLDPESVTSHSLHAAAIDSIPTRAATLEAGASAAAERSGREHLEAAERIRTERLDATLAALRTSTGNDVRGMATLSTYKLLQLATRLAPHSTGAEGVPGVRGKGAGHSGAASTGSGAHAGDGVGAGRYSTDSVSDAVAAAMSTALLPSGAGAGTTGTPAPDLLMPAWRPRGVLVAHLMEHRKGVTDLAVARGGDFVVSGSADETVKVWDLRRLEHDMSFCSQLTYAAQAGRIMSVAAVDDDSSVASASASGSIHVWRVEVAAPVRPTGAAGMDAPRYTGIVSKRQISPGLGAVSVVRSWGQLLLYVTQRGGVSALDLRCRQDAWNLPAKPHLGLLEHLVVSPYDTTWLLTGSSRGFLQLWDVRFQLPANSWQHPLGDPISALAVASAPPVRLGVNWDGPGPLVYVAAGYNEVALWDVVECRCHQVFKSYGLNDKALAAQGTPDALQAPAVVPHAATSEAGSASSRLPESGPPKSELLSTGVRALIPTATGQLITGSKDRSIRLWDGSSPKSSYVIAGPPLYESGAESGSGGAASLQIPQYSYHSRTVGGVPVVEELCERNPSAEVPSGPEQRARMRLSERSHLDAITAMVTSDMGSRLLLTASRDGVVKAWK